MLCISQKTNCAVISIPSLPWPCTRCTDKPSAARRAVSLPVLKQHGFRVEVSEAEAPRHREPRVPAQHASTKLQKGHISS